MNSPPGSRAEGLILLHMTQQLSGTLKQFTVTSVLQPPEVGSLSESHLEKTHSRLVRELMYVVLSGHLW